MKTKKQHQVNDTIFVTMCKPAEGRGNFPIGRTDEGMICRLQFPTDIKFVEYDSVWMCAVLEVHENKLIVEPFSLEISAEENRHNAAKKAKEAFGKQKQERKKRQTYSYPFKASYEK